MPNGGTRQNPADVATRGITPSQLRKLKLWWHGPQWLTEKKINIPSRIELPSLIPEKKANVTALTTQIHEQPEILSRFSTFNRLQRVVAYIYRFYHNTSNKSSQRLGALTTHELNNATNVVIRLSQSISFHQEIADLTKGKCLKSNSQLLPLKPFLDESGLLRLGGRIDNAPLLAYTEKHQILLHKDCPLSSLLVKFAHNQTLHVKLCPLPIKKSKVLPDQ
ncbi:hypothetical protein TKK_0009769 [Trichogramma kaykai]